MLSGTTAASASHRGLVTTAAQTIRHVPASTVATAPVLARVSTFDNIEIQVMFWAVISYCRNMAY